MKKDAKKWGVMGYAAAVAERAAVAGAAALQKGNHGYDDDELHPIRLVNESTGKVAGQPQF